MPEDLRRFDPSALPFSLIEGERLLGILVHMRHGKATPDGELTEDGRRELRRNAPKLFPGVTFTAAFCSDMPRTRKSAKAILNGMSHAPLDIEQARVLEFGRLMDEPGFADLLWGYQNCEDRTSYLKLNPRLREYRNSVITWMHRMMYETNRPADHAPVILACSHMPLIGVAVPLTEPRPGLIRPGMGLVYYIIDGPGEHYPCMTVNYLVPHR